MDTLCRKELTDTPSDIKLNKEFIKKKRLEWFIRKEELEEAMNKLSIDERAIIKDVLLQIQQDEIDNRNCKRRAELAEIAAISSARLDDYLKKQKELAKEKKKILKMKAVGLLCTGTLVYVCAAIITR